MIACAADEIVCDPSSIVGSIGVIGATFGFPDAMKKLGIERRVYTAGDHKSTLDPFLAEDEHDVARLKAIQQDIHRMFIGLVRERRGERLAGSDDALFSGEYWVAKTAKDLGLIDQLGDVRAFLRQRFGEDVITPPVPAERSLFGRRTPGVAGIASEGLLGFGVEPHGLVDDVISALEARAIWARFGL
jgi:ClpP class serine protease